MGVKEVLSMEDNRIAVIGYKDGLCPNCGCGDIEWGEFIYGDGVAVTDVARYEGVCTECGCEFVERYHLRYTGTVGKMSNKEM